jgi:hypothetical protein
MSKGAKSTILSLRQITFSITMVYWTPTAMSRLEYWILDSQPVKESEHAGYKERFIHGEIYKRFHEVQCVIHSHDDNVMPFATSGVPFMPIFHMAGFLGEQGSRPIRVRNLSVDTLSRTKCAGLRYRALL